MSIALDLFNKFDGVDPDYVEKLDCYYIGIGDVMVTINPVSGKYMLIYKDTDIDFFEGVLDEKDPVSQRLLKYISGGIQ